MASYMVNPSKKVTEFLSQFLEFDPQQLHLGIWSGDLSLTDVNLKQKAFAPLLNPASSAGGDHLHLKLVTGKVGHMRIQIPWKRLVWGQSDVQLHISDVDIVLAYESREETSRRMKKLKNLDSTFSDSFSDEEEEERTRVLTELERENKQMWLQEAERLHLRGFSIPESFGIPIDDKAQDTDEVPAHQKEAGRIDSFLRQATSSIVWRFFAGLQASIRNVRIVIVQDGIEVGVIQHSMEVKAGKQSDKTAETEPTSDFTDLKGASSDEMDSFATPPSDFEYQGEFDDGEHVDKTIEVQGFGIFIRKLPKRFIPPPHLRFSLSVNADDFVLRPVNLTLALSFFYPHPMERRKKKNVMQPKSDEPIKSPRSTEETVSESSSIRRRGKREKQVALFVDVSRVSVRPPKHVSRKSSLPSVTEHEPDFATRSADVEPREKFQKRERLSSDTSTMLPPMTELKEYKSEFGSTYRLGYTNEAKSVMDTTKSYAGSRKDAKNHVQIEYDLSPKLDLNLTFTEVKTVFSSRHYNYCLIFISTLKRMHRGRPEKSINSCINDEEPEAVRSVVVDAPLIDPVIEVDPMETPNIPRPRSVSKRSLTEGWKGFSAEENSFKTPTTIKPADGLSRFTSDQMPTTMRKQMHLRLTFQPVKFSEKQRVIRRWWIYAYKCVLREIRERKKKKAKFDGSLFKFDWQKQKYRRKEYVNFYLRHNVTKSGGLHAAEIASFLKGENVEERMRVIEDEIPIEQILLYRSIARALSVRGINELGDSIALIHKDERGVRNSYAQNTPMTNGRHTETRQDRLKRLRHTPQSTSELAVNDLTPFSKISMMTLTDKENVNDLKAMCNAARKRRDTKISEKPPTSPTGRFDSALGPHTNSLFREVDAEAFSQKYGTWRQPDSSARPTPVTSANRSNRNLVLGRHAGMTVDMMSKSTESQAKSFKTAITSPKTTSNSFPATKQLHFSFAFKLEKMELLILKDEAFDDYQGDVGSAISSFTLGRERTFEQLAVASVYDDEVSSDGISHLTDDANFSDNDEMNSDFEYDNGNPMLSSSDFLTFGSPAGVVLDISVTPLHGFVTGLSGGSKSMGLNVGRVHIEGKDKCQLLTAGTTALDDLRQPIGVPTADINMVQRRQAAGNVRRSKETIKGAVRANYLLADNEEHFVEIDIAKIVASIDLGAVVALKEFAEVPSSFVLPKPLIAESELDEIRDYILSQSDGSLVLKKLQRIDCALRLHGVDVFVPAFEIESVAAIPRERIKVSLNLVEYYSGSLVEHIYLSAAQNPDDRSRYSGGKSSAFVSASSGLSPVKENCAPGGRRMQLLDVCNVYEQQRSVGTDHAIMNASGIQLCVEVPSTSSCRSFPLLSDHVDLEIFLTNNNETGSDGAYTNLIVALSPCLLLISPKRLSLLSHVLTNQLQESESSSVLPIRCAPRLDALAKKKVFSLHLVVNTVSMTIVSDSDNVTLLTPSEKEVIIEECVSDFLAFIACFDLQNPGGESLEVARQACTQRLIGIGLKEDVAIECVEFALHQFHDDIDLVRKAQIETLGETTAPADRLPESIEDFASDDESILDCTNLANEENSVVSLDILDTAIQNAVEQTLSKILPLVSDSSPLQDTLTVEASRGFRIRATQMFYDIYLSAQMPQLTIRNGSGVQIFSVCGVSLPTNEDDAESNSDKSDIGPNKFKMENGLNLTLFELDTGFDFGVGGSPLSFLGSDDIDSISRCRERVLDVRMGSLDFIFCSPILEKTFEMIDKMSGAINRTSVHQSDTSDNIDRETRGANTGLSIDVESFSLLIMSDEFVPFTKFNFKKLVCRFSSEVVISATDFSVYNLTPEGQHFSRIVYALDTEPQLGLDAENAIQLTFQPSTRPWKVSSSMLVEMKGVQVLFLRQYTRELTQFLISEKYGLGRLLSRSASEAVIDENGNHAPPLSFNIVLTNSSIVIPKSSISADLVAIEVSSLTVFNSFHERTFQVPDSSTGMDKGEARSFATTMPLSSQTQSEAAHEIEFYDCIETTNVRPVSSFNNNLLSRINVHINEANIYSALPPRKAQEGNTESLQYLRDSGLSGRAQSGKCVFGAITEGGTHRTHISNPTLSWECITSHAFSLEVLVDFTPEFRLLITDDISDEGGPLSLDLQAKMSQFYLLLSLWYENMQELPILFPYSDEEIKINATYSQPPTDLPEYGTDDFVQWLMNIPRFMSSEIVCHFLSISMDCSFDSPGYFDVDPASLNLLPDSFKDKAGKAAVSLALEECVVHVATDQNAIMRIGCGARSFCIRDQRKTNPYNEFIVLNSGGYKRDTVPSESNDEERVIWADLCFGLDKDGSTLVGAPQTVPFQASVFMTPGWVLVNVGVESPDAVMVDFSPIWILLDYYSKYFSSDVFGNPVFEATRSKEKTKEMLQKVSRKADKLPSSPGSGIDFRLWLLRPFLSIPSDLSEAESPSLRIHTNSGFWYQYKSVGTFSTQEMGSPELSLQFCENFLQPRFGRDADSGNRKTLIDSLSFGLRMDYNGETNHSDYAFCMPFWSELIEKPSKRCKIAGPELDILPVELALPRVCIPCVTICRDLGGSVCEITAMVELLPLTASLLMSLVGAGGDSGESDSRDSKMIDTASSSQGPSFAFSARIESVRLFIIDPTLGVHLPLAAVCLSSMKVTGSRLGTFTNRLFLRRDSPISDLQIIVETNIWADYFKLGITRSWEPLLEPFMCLVLYEKSMRRGEGLTLTSDTPFHLNVTGALLLSLEDAIDSLSQAILETFGPTNEQAENRGNVEHTNKAKLERVVVKQSIELGPRQVKVQHRIPKVLSHNERLAFSLLNLTGQRIRIHQGQERADHESEPAAITYLAHAETTPLDFQATISVIENLRLVEVPFPGFSHPSRGHTGNKDPASHCVDVQLPGFKWLQGVSVDTSGRRFDDIVPRSSVVFSKISNDWRLSNTMKLLTEVGLDNGGRLITVRSLFEIRNHTTHSISLNLHPDPMHKPSTGTKSGYLLSPRMSVENTPGENYESLQPGDAVQIPALLLEAALRLEGCHLGCVWVRPETNTINKELLESMVVNKDLGLSNPTVGFSSRPVQLAKIVHESALLFHAAKGEDLAPDKVRSGIQISCPIADGGDGVPVAPFCYAVEIRRSPIVRDQRDFTSEANVGLKGSKTNSERSPVEPTRRDRKVQEATSLSHSPVAYTLMIHPPIVVENLLPAHGRFELMHATRRTVLWFGNLKPGEKVSIHSVGLDAPLLLLVNLGFCRTPIGEGALIHHGAEAIRNPLQSGGLKSIGKAVTKGTKQIGKTLTSMADSPDFRGKGKVLLLQNSEYNRTGQKSRRKGKSLAEVTGSLGLDTEFAADDASSAHVHLVDSRVYTADEIATETVVVDSVGQKLTLKIENVRGGGGQRRVSLFCPFWIVNTTEHALRYKQDKSSYFVSGTVLSPSVDGSAEVDRNDTILSKSEEHLSSVTDGRASMDIASDSMSRPVFSGTPGALSTFPGRLSVSRERLAKLLEKELPLNDLASIAFMFNFHEDSLLIGHQRLVVQLADGTGRSPYASDWSPGFSLESVGVPQLCSMHCKDGRVLELSVTISVAPGFLSGYTKIVRFTPRYIIVNRLKQPVRIWQDSSLLHSPFEDRSTQEASARRDVRKWDFRLPNERHLNKDNGYELLFGRPATIDEITVGGVPLGTTAHKSALYIATAGQDDLIPFHLPDTRGERQFRVDLGGNWNLSSSFDADVTGEHTLRFQKALDLRLMTHVNTRASPHYKVSFPPLDGSPWDGELGVWFETAWGAGRKILVKGTKRGKYAFRYTDIRVGDELLQVDDVLVSSLTFTETTKLLKERLSTTVTTNRTDPEGSMNGSTHRPRNSILNWAKTRMERSESNTGWEDALGLSEEEPHQVVLTFRTLEERLMRVRMKASRTKQIGRVRASLLSMSRNERNNLSEAEESSRLPIIEENQLVLKVEMRAIHNSIFVVVREQNPENPPYRIENRAMNHFIFYRQRGCVNFPWNIIHPGESAVYSWEEPMKTRKLTVRVGAPDLNLQGDDKNNRLESGHGDDASVSERRAAKKARLMQYLSFHNVIGEDQAGFGGATTVKLEEIGFECALPCVRTSSLGYSEKTLNCMVDSNGATRVLVISNTKDGTGEKPVLQQHIHALQNLTREEENRTTILRNYLTLASQQCRSPDRNTGCLVNSRETDSIRSTSKSKQELEPSEVDIEQIEKEATELAEFPEDCTIWRRHQLVIQVLEAAGLSTSDVTGVCNPYCEIVLKGGKKRRSLFSTTNLMKKTYFMEGSFSPKWIDQNFVFDIPPDAIESTREHTLQVRVRSFRFIGHHPYLGQTNVHLRNLRNQKELVGWYPLVGRTGPRDLEASQANWGRGSVKLRVQWIYTVPALVEYFLMLSEKRLCDFQHSLDGMKAQLHSLVANESTKNIMKSHEMSKEMLKDPFGVASRFLQARPPQKRKKQTAQGQKKMVRGSRTAQDNNKLPLTARRSIGSEESLLGEYLSDDRRRSLQGTHNLSVLDENSPPTFGSQGSIDTLSDHPLMLRGSSDSAILRSSRHGQRQRSLSLEDFTRSMEGLELTKRVGPFKKIGSALGGFGQLSGQRDLLANSEDAGTAVPWSIEHLLERGLVFHGGESTFHRNHLTYHFRFTLNQGAFHTPYNVIRPKSLQRISRSDCRFKTMLTAQAVLNDSQLVTKVSQGKLELALSTPSKINVKRRVTLQEDTRALGLSIVSCKEVVLKKVGVPSFAPSEMRERIVQRAERLYRARNKFERACKRSLRAVLNPGGWLTVRPIAALNLPDTYTGMSVKLRYGSLSLSTPTVDARVTPRWTNDQNHLKKQSKTKLLQKKIKSIRYHGAHDYDASQQNLGTDPHVPSTEVNPCNDLSIPIDPQKTSGSIRLSVVGERLNSKVELGVLDIPLGGAINCCVESMENALDETGDGDQLLNDTAYVRFFPLMNPKDSLPFDGDMGNSGRPLESEQESDSTFSQYFSPCIKLALIWRPREADDDVDVEDGSIELSGCTSQKDATIGSFPSRSYFNADIARLSCALIHSQKGLELLALSATDIDIRYFVSKIKTRIGFVVGWIQIDHQIESTREPVVLAPKPVLHPNPTLQFLVSRDNLRSKGKTDSYELIAFYMEELDLTVEESWMVEVWDFFVSVIRRREVKKRATNFLKSHILGERNELMMSLKFTSPLDEPHQSLLEMLWLDDSSEAKTYIEKLYLGPVRVNLSYFKGRRTKEWDTGDFGSYLLEGVDGLPEVLKTAGFLFRGNGNAHYSEIFAKWTEFTHDEDMWTESGEGKKSVNLPNILAAVLPSVSEAPIRLQGKGITFIFEDQGEIINSIKNYYVNETLKQIYKILGSLDFVGNPTMVLNSFATGVRDFFVTPSKEFMRTPNNPSRVGLGVVKGTLSLLSHSASGLFGFAAKMSATAGQAAAIFSFDQDYQVWHRDMILSEAKSLDRHWKRRGVGGVSRIITRPVFDVLRGVGLGVTGLIIQPIKGARRDGTVGLVKGVAIGSIGVVTKPVVGILDAFSHFAGSIHDVAKSVNVLEKRYQPAKKLRLPYTFSLRNVLVPFNAITARSALLLRKFPASKGYLPDSLQKTAISILEVHVESEVLETEPGVETFVIISTLRVVLIKVKKDYTGALIPSLCWEVPLFAENSKVSSRLSDQGHNGVALTVARRFASSKNPETALSNTPIHYTEDKMGTESISSLYSGSHVGERTFSSPSNTKAVIVPSSSLPTIAEEARTLPIDAQSKEGTDFQRSVLASTGDMMELFTVLAEFNHRGQLSRLHNAICCVAGNMDSIIFDRGLNNDGSTEGYTSFGEFFFAKRGDEVFHKSAKAYQDDDLEEVPWVPSTFFDSISQDAVVDQDLKFASMRRQWNMEKEFAASEAFGGPEWLVKARAEATFVPEQPPSVPDHIPHSHHMQMVFMNLYEGKTSYDEAVTQVKNDIERRERMLSFDESQISARRHMSSNPYNSSSSDLFESTRERSSTDTIATNSSDFKSAQWSSPFAQTLPTPRKSSSASLGDEYLFDAETEDRNDESVESVAQQSSSLDEEGTGQVLQRIDDILEADPSPKFSSESDERMIRLEQMLDKLLQISIVNAEGKVAHLTSDESASASLLAEVSRLRADITELKDQEHEEIALLRKEIEELKDGMTKRQPSTPIKRLPEIVHKKTQELKASTRKTSQNVKEAGKKISKFLRTFHDGKDKEELETAAFANTVTIAEVERGIFPLDDLEKSIDDDEMITMSEVDRFVSDLSADVDG